MQHSAGRRTVGARITRRIAIGVMFALVVTQTMAFNRPGHMTTAAVAFLDLEERSPSALARTLEVLREHPFYAKQWLPKIKADNLNEREADMYLFMAAARWPDDVRGMPEYHQPKWHYVNIPYKPADQPAWVKARPAPRENIFAGYAVAREALQSGEASTEDSAIELCWLFHLIGDAHQPLHSIAMFTTAYPNGDLGGNLQYVKWGSTPVALHSYWDSVALTVDKFDAVHSTAKRLTTQHPKDSYPEAAENRMRSWIRESYDLAISETYLHGKLRTGKVEDNTAPHVPQGYEANARSITEKRIALAGYRLADQLIELYGP